MLENGPTHILNTVEIQQTLQTNQTMQAIQGCSNPKKDQSNFFKQIILTIWTEVIFAENSEADDVF